VVKLNFVKNPLQQLPDKPIGVIRALVTGFERVAAKPVLILPILLLDLMLWFGPHLSIASLIPTDLSAWMANGAFDASATEQLAVIQEALDLVRDRVNLFSALSVLPTGMPFNLLVATASLPAGIPSLMARRLPIENPLGSPTIVSIDSPLVGLFTWGMMILIGLGAAVVYHRLLADQVEDQEDFGSGWLAWARLFILYLMAYIGSLIVLGATILIASFIAQVSTLISAGLILLGMSLLFWAAIYLAFTAHGIIRYGLGLMQAMVESVYIVRTNLLSAVGLLFLAFGITWFATDQIWLIPADQSWYGMLGIIGNAFVGTTLLTSSYVYYQGRRSWLRRAYMQRLEDVMEAQEPSDSVE
jgi:hypothetical protein